MTGTTYAHDPDCNTIHVPGPQPCPPQRTAEEQRLPDAEATAGPTVMYPRIHGRKLLQALMDAGIIRKGEYVRRVVIDAGVNTAVVIYKECYGDTRTLNIAKTLESIEISEVPYVEPEPFSND